MKWLVVVALLGCETKQRGKEAGAELVEEERAIADAMCACKGELGCRDRVVEKIRLAVEARVQSKTVFVETTPEQDHEITKHVERRTRCRQELDLLESRAIKR